MRASTLLLTPLRMELDLLIKFFPAHWKSEKMKIGKLEAVAFQDLQLICAVGGHGKVQFAIHTQFFLNHIENLSRVICVGAAGDCTAKMQIGDVIVAEKIVEHDFNLKFIKRPLPEFPCDPQALDLLKRTQFNKIQVSFGTIASGDEDVIAPTRRQEIHELTKAKAVAWEGAGGARACAFHHIPYLEIRGLTDQADQEAIKDFKINLEDAMKNCALIVEALVQS